MSNDETVVPDEANLADIIAGLPAPISRPGNLVERNINGTIVRKPSFWWNSFDVAYDRMNASKFSATAMTAFVDRMTQGGMDATGLEVFGMQYGVDVSAFRGGGGGGSGVGRAERIKSLAARIKNDSRTLGIQLDDDKIAYLATVAEKLNYSEDQVRDDILKNVDWNTIQGGDLKAQVDLVKALSKSYLVSVDDNLAKEYSVRMSSGELSQDGLNNIFRAQSVAANPWAKSAIEQGLTPADLLKNHQQYVAKSLDLDPNTIDLTDDQYLKMMTVTDQGGSSRVATLNELRSNVRKDARWANTSEARDLGSSMATMVAQIFGRSSF